MYKDTIRVISTYKDLLANIEVTVKLLEEKIKFWKFNSIKNTKFAFGVEFGFHSKLYVLFDVETEQFHVKSHIDGVKEEILIKYYQKINAEPKYIHRYGDCVESQHHFKFSNRNCLRVFNIFVLFMNINSETKLPS